MTSARTLRFSSSPLFDMPARRVALFLDLDGTLAPFAATPLEVGPDAARTALVRRLALLLEGRLAVVSGRTLAEIDRILDGAAATAAGVHGLQRRLAGAPPRMAAPHPLLVDAVQFLAAFKREAPGTLLEVKPLSVALHYRNAPTAGPEVRRLAGAYAAKTGLLLQEGVMVVELLTPGTSKGDAVRDFMSSPPFRGATPIFLGDDLTDEAGFEAAADLGGYGVIVGSRQNTLAAGRIAGVPETLDWLDACCARGAFRMGVAADPAPGAVRPSPPAAPGTRSLPND
jgi:trehalose 6-phosphate phosphatase